ncbi:MAG: Fic family protein [Fervidobacterium sp.]|uniref:Fic/DOC family protein n=1 Tax=Fervidobacterium gondwanense DSM 13020 TaxID=1121883 RepID=A0A1M7RSM7_FERGO|nr:Fic family protein [Fervidobacterium gondwanense]UXF00306.1 hypothetical protein IB67_01575 [Fervidobacterium riparium]SHN49078.1 Fic/DOC family protein [Fervidobacterium gondwanense DSM 13020]
MNNVLHDLIKWRKSLCNFVPIEVTNKEWLYMLKEETRNSIMIEGIFATEEELENAVGGRYKAASEVSNYFRTAKMLYGMALEYSKTGESPYFLAFVKSVHRFLFDGLLNEKKLGAFRSGPIRITGAKIRPPEYDLDDWIRLWLEFTKYAYSKFPVHEATAMSHVFFESIHPFEDGNGRAGRLLMNFFLIYNGYLNVTIKGVENEDRNMYIKSLESAERGLRKILRESPKKLTVENIESCFRESDIQELAEIIGYALIDTYDKIICKTNEEKLMSVDEFSSIIGKSADAVRKMIERKTVIAIKIGGRWAVYPEYFKLR